MAERVEAVLTAKDQSAGAFASFVRSVDKAEAALMGLVAGVAGGAALGALTALPQALEAAFSKVDPRGIIDAADSLNKLSQRSGIAIENLQALEYAGKLADVSSDELAASLKKLNVNIAAAARGEKEQAEAFKAIGVAVKDASGNVRSADDVLGDVADKFAGYADGANKVAIANALGGKSFEKLIPLLNGGRQGIQDAKEELQKFGVLLGPEFSRKAEQFNDNLTKLSVSAQALKVAVASGLIDDLVEVSDKFVEASKNGTKLDFVLDRLKYTLSGQQGREFLFGKSLPPDKLQESQKEVEELTTRLARLQDYLSRNPNSSGTQKAIDALTAKIAAAKGAEVDLKAAGTAAFRRAEVLGADFSPAPKKKKDAPPLPSSTGADDREQLLRKALDGRLKTIRDSLENERDLFQFGQRQLDASFQEGELSIDEYYKKKGEAAKTYLDAQVKSLDAEIAAQQDYESKTGKAANRADAENKITEAKAAQTRAYREFGQAAEVSGRQAIKASEDAQRGILELDAQMAELGGDKLGADLARNAIRLQEVQRQLAKVGGDPQREAQLRSLLDTTAKFAKVQDDVSRITDRAATAEEAFMIAADRGGKSLLETEQGIKAIRENAIRQLDVEIAKTEELLKTSTDPTLLDYYEQLRVKRAKAFDAVDPSLTRFRNALEEVGQIGTNSLDDILLSTGKLSDKFKAAEKDLVKLITHDFLTAPLGTSISNFLKDISGTGGQKAGGVGGGDLFSAIGSWFSSGSTSGGASSWGAGLADIAAAWYHSGGIAGDMKTHRMVNPLVFAGADRYHGGGIVNMRRRMGLQADEVPAVLRRGEQVLRTDDPNHVRNRGGGARGVQVSNTFVLQQPASRDTQAEVAKRAGLAIQAAMARNT